MKNRVTYGSLTVNVEPSPTRLSHGDRAVVAIDDPLHEAEAEAGAVGARRSRRIGLEEALEDVRRDVGRHADAGVAHVDPRAAGRRATRAARRGRLRCVNLIALSSRFSSSRCSQPASPLTSTVPLRSQRRSIVRACATGSSCSTSDAASSPTSTGANVRRNLAGLGARQREDLIDQARQPIELLDLAGQRRAARPRRGPSAQRQLDLAAQRRERRAQLVGERGAELPHLADRVLEPRQRVVERASPRRRARRARRASAARRSSVRTSISRAAPASARERPQREAGQPPRPRARPSEERRRAAATAAGRDSGPARCPSC